MGKKDDEEHRRALEEAERLAREVKPEPKPEPKPNRDDPGMEYPGA